MSEQLERAVVRESASIRDAVKRMDSLGMGIILCTNAEGAIAGLMTDGDFRRAVLGNVSLELPVSTIMNREFQFLPVEYSETQFWAVFRNARINVVPVLDNERRVVELLRRSDLTKLRRETIESLRTLDIPVVIMAGGKGTRLKPYTQVLPKPLIPIGDKTIIEMIMDNFAHFGMTSFHISLNYKARMIRAYFEDRDSSARLHFFEEPKPLGTAGALRYLKDLPPGPLFVTNCDVLIQADYPAILDYHQSNGFDFTMVACMQHQRLPYGICEIADGGELVSIREKPELDLLVNTGFYLLNQQTLSLIPEDTYFDMTDFLAVLRKKGARIGVFPISQNSWIDTGQMEQLDDAFHRLTSRRIDGSDQFQRLKD